MGSASVEAGPSDGKTRKAIYEKRQGALATELRIGKNRPNSQVSGDTQREVYVKTPEYLKP